MFLARDNAMLGANRLVVIKRILPHLARDVRFVRMFVDEARLNMHMSPPNIAYTFEVGKVQDSYFIAMEFVHGEDLRRVLNRHDPRLMTPAVACLVASRVAAALHHAHDLVDAERPHPRRAEVRPPGASDSRAGRLP